MTALDWFIIKRNAGSTLSLPVRGMAWSTDRRIQAKFLRDIEYKQLLSQEHFHCCVLFKIRLKILLNFYFRIFQYFGKLRWIWFKFQSFAELKNKKRLFLSLRGTSNHPEPHFVRVSLRKLLDLIAVNQHRLWSIDRERKKLGTVCEVRGTQRAECSPARCARKLAAAEFRRKYTGCPRDALEAPLRVPAFPWSLI